MAAPANAFTKAFCFLIFFTAAFAFLRNRLVKTVIEVGAIVEDLFERFRPESA